MLGAPLPGMVVAYLLIDAQGRRALIFDAGKAADYAALHHAVRLPLVVPAWAVRLEGVGGVGEFRGV